MNPTDIAAYMAHVGVAARAASRAMAAAPTAAKDAALRALARRLRANGAALQAANAKDVAAAESAGLAAPLVDRLKLSARRSTPSRSAANNSRRCPTPSAKSST